MTLPDLSWMDNGACKGQPSKFWFPEGNDDREEYYADRRRGIQICSECPVKAPCREFGLYQEFGTWGGMDQAERRVERRLRGIEIKKEEEPPEETHPGCGTPAGYRWLLRRSHREGTEMVRCVPCDVAHVDQYKTYVENLSDERKAARRKANARQSRERRERIRKLETPRSGDE